MDISTLSDKQIQCFQDSDARINLFEGPVRAGKSFISLLRWIEFCRSGPPGALIICGRTDKTIKRNIIAPLQDMIGSAVKYSIGKGEVQIYNRTMYVVGANDDRSEAKIRGSEFAGALLDEVTLLPESFFKMLLSRLSIPGAQLFASTNPDSPYHWLKRDFIDRKDELDLKTFSFSIYDNPSLTEKYIKDLSAEYQGLWYSRYIEGKWVLADGAVYDFFNESIHVIDWPRATADYYIVGIDYGTTNPTAAVLVGFNPSASPTMWVEDEYYYDSKRELRQKSDYEYARELIEWMKGHYIKYIYMDPSAASLKSELRRNGVHQIVDANNDVIPGIRFVSTQLSSGALKICSSCKNLIMEMGNYLWDSKASARGEDKPIKAFDHACVTGDMLVETEDSVLEIGNLPPDTRISSWDGDSFVYKPCSGGYKTRTNVDVYRLTLKNGSTIRATTDHLFSTSLGWQALSSLSLNSYIQVKYDPSTTINGIGFDKVHDIRYHGKEDVYCTSVLGTGTMVVNGIVTKNCDALRYACMTHFFNRHSGGMTSDDAKKYEDMYMVRL